MQSLDLGKTSPHSQTPILIRLNPKWSHVNRAGYRAGYTAYTCVIGAYAYWGPKAAKALFAMDNADTLFGAITVVAGVGGTISGGVALDRMGGGIRNACKVGWWS